jgi:hypothetical protein
MTAGFFVSSFRDAPLGAGPESITLNRGYGFRTRSLCSRSGMTIVRSHKKALQVEVQSLSTAKFLKDQVPNEQSHEKAIASFDCRLQHA